MSTSAQPMVVESNEGANSDLPEVDLSHITPRELISLLSDWIKSGRISTEDASCVLGVISTDALDNRLDVPVNMYEGIEGIASFHDYIRDPEGASSWRSLATKLQHLERFPHGLSTRA
ncbi:hypothetical protein FHW69_002159 [Luteibacter sp. Sphag1AF]|uniref:hypothetical protein n=1 Tax=Luteibacter sp. Sphag1AF TaxID=2587031 RepID=UPI0016128641|nr:hypothetical protein [Luteibacter sp. Sphag1AF]MBB3227536.1 hypothetical protein [Luteibacter sp. Sphag1AF]